jgi:hypothetical protein
MRLTGAQMLKLVGAAGVVGVAATGVMVVRDERKRQAYPPDEVREQLHARLTQAVSSGSTIAPPPKPTVRERFQAWRDRRQPSA